MNPVSLPSWVLLPSRTNDLHEVPALWNPLLQALTGFAMKLTPSLPTLTYVRLSVRQLLAPNVLTCPLRQAPRFGLLVSVIVPLSKV